jgi:CRISPR-associated protein Cmr5
MEQQRAAFALQSIEDFLALDKTSQAELRRYLIHIPALIHMNGLGQALAFYRMKGPNSNHELIYQLLGKWLCQETPGRVFDGHAGDLLKAITSSDYRCYMAAQNEALAVLEWLKKFATALLHKEV